MNRIYNLVRDKVVAHLEKNGIQTRMLFAGNIVRHPCFDEMRESLRGYREVGDLKNTDAIMNRSFWVGVYQGMSAKMINYMIRVIRQSAGSCR